MRVVAWSGAVVAALAAIGVTAWIVLDRVFLLDKLPPSAVERQLDGQWGCKHVWWRIGWFGSDYECTLLGDSAFTCVNIEVDRTTIRHRSAPFLCHAQPGRVDAVAIATAAAILFGTLWTFAIAVFLTVLVALRGLRPVYSARM